MEYNLSFIKDLKDFFFYDITLRNLDRTSEIKYYIESKEKELSELIALVHVLLKKFLFLLHYSLNYDKSLLELLNECLDSFLNQDGIKKVYSKEWQK